MPLDRERRGPISEFDNGDDDDDDESVTRSSDAEGVNFAFGVCSPNAGCKLSGVIAIHICNSAV